MTLQTQDAPAAGSSELRSALALQTAPEFDSSGSLICSNSSLKGSRTPDSKSALFKGQTRTSAVPKSLYQQCINVSYTTRGASPGNVRILWPNKALQYVCLCYSEARKAVLHLPSSASGLVINHQRVCSFLPHQHLLNHTLKARIDVSRFGSPVTAGMRAATGRSRVW